MYLNSKKLIFYFLSECQVVYISIVDGGNDNESFQLIADSGSMELHGILCENGKVVKS